MSGPAKNNLTSTRPWRRAYSHFLNVLQEWEQLAVSSLSRLKSSDGYGDDVCCPASRYGRNRSETENVRAVALPAKLTYTETKPKGKVRRERSRHCFNSLYAL